MKSFRVFFSIFFSGMLVGAADIVPGISGGTVAFILGIYEELLKSIASFNLKAFSYLFRLQLPSFFQAVAWRFLLVFVLGAAVSFAFLAKGVTFLLHHELYRTFLYAAFMGLVVGSILFCARLLPRFDKKTALFLFCGAVAACFLSGTVSVQ